MDVKICDFDDVEYHIVVTPEEKDFVQLSMRMRCAKDLMPMGLKTTLDQVFGSALQDKTEPLYDITLKWNMLEVQKSADWKKIIQNAAELRRIAMCSPLERCLDALAKDQAANLKPMQIKYRQKESIFVVPAKDRVLVMISLDFLGDTDRAVANVFLNSFTEAQRKMQNAPPVLFSQGMPTELKANFPTVKEDPSVLGYIFFTMLKMHVDKPEKVKNCAQLLASFRSYVHYHVKGAKTYLQSRMRMRCELLLKVLNRANPETASAESGAGRRNTTTNVGGVAAAVGKVFRKF